MIVEVLITLTAVLISIAIVCAILYFVVKAAVEQGVKDALLSLQVRVDRRNTVKDGVLEALREIQKDKVEEKDG